MRLAGVGRCEVACAVAGAAVWFTNGSLDVCTAEPFGARIAMLPPLWLLLVLVLLGFSCGAVLRRISENRSWNAHDAITPLFALASLVLPYLPWLPDALPVLRVLAGPCRFLVWACVLTQMVWPVKSPRLDGRRAAALIFIASALAFGGASALLTHSSPFPTGDEPHYLIITQSLLLDHDLKIENNHKRGQYREYYPRDLSPHYLTRGVDGEIHSVHPIGLPILALPAFAIGGYRGVVIFLVLLAAAAATLMWRWARDASGSAGAATFAWAAVCLSAPYFFNSITVYPEIPGALCVMIVLAFDTREMRWPMRVLQGIAAGLLPWLSTKYAPMAAVLVLIVLLRPPSRIRAAATVLLPFLACLAAWLASFYFIWGTPSPSAPYGNTRMTSLRNALTGAPALLFDQEYGVLAYAPLLAAAAAGLIALRRRGHAPRAAFEIAAAFASLLMTVGAFEIWWGGTAAPGRPLVSGLLLLGPAIAAQYASSEERPFTRAMLRVMLALGLSITVVLLFAERGGLLLNGRDGVSELLRWSSPTWHLWAIFPSFILQPSAIALAHSAIWVGVSAAVFWVFRRFPAGASGSAALCASLGAGAVLLLGSILSPLALRDRIGPRINLAARESSPLLASYDSRTLPTAILYAPLSRIASEDVPGRILFAAAPGLHREAPPIPLLWDARFSLPAGEYRVTLTGDPAKALAGRLDLKIGRNGPACEKWPVEATPGASWTHNFRLDLDSGLVGFLTSKDLTAAKLQVQPLRIMDAEDRMKSPDVLAAVRYSTATVYFHDEDTYPQELDFWTRGDSSATLTIAPQVAAPEITLELMSGVAEQIDLSTGPWHQRVDLSPGTPQSVRIPAGRADGPTRVRIVTTGGYVPHALNPRDPDRRVLGCCVRMPG